MKKLSMLLSILAIVAAHGESLQTDDSLDAFTARWVQETPLRLDEIKPNEIKAGKLTYSGIAIEAIKMDNLLELINPAAAIQYGSAEANFVKDPVGGRFSGLKIFSIEF